MKRKIRDEDGDESGGCEKRKNLKANMNAMYCNRRTRDRDRLSKWIEEIKLETEPRERIAWIEKKRENIESKWATHYISENPRGKNLSPRIAWHDLWQKMDLLISEAQSEIQRSETITDMRENVAAHDGLDENGEGTSSKACTDEMTNHSIRYEPTKGEKGIVSKVCRDRRRDRSTSFDLIYNCSLSKLYATNILNEGYRKSAEMTIVKQKDGGRMFMSDRRNKEQLAILPKEFEEARIAVINEKISGQAGFERKLYSVENQTSDSQLQPDAYIQTILKLTKSNDALMAKNKRLDIELVEAKIRQGELQQMLSIWQKKVALLVNELSKAQLEILKGKLDPYESIRAGINNRSITNVSHSLQETHGGK